MIPNPNPLIQWFLTTAIYYLGTPYVWAGDDPSGFDCSGFVLECLKSVGLFPENEDINADGLMNRLIAKRIWKPQTGALLFRLGKDGKAQHVVICLDDQFQIGANGGTSKDSSADQAWKDNAFVKIRPLPSDLGKYVIVDPFSKAA